MADADEDVMPRGMSKGDDVDLSDETQDFRFLTSISYDLTCLEAVENVLTFRQKGRCDDPKARRERFRVAWHSTPVEYLGGVAAGHAQCPFFPTSPPAERIYRWSLPSRD